MGDITESVSLGKPNVPGLASTVATVMSYSWWKVFLAAPEAITRTPGFQPSQSDACARFLTNCDLQRSQLQLWFGLLECCYVQESPEMNRLKIFHRTIKCSHKKKFVTCTGNSKQNSKYFTCVLSLFCFPLGVEEKKEVLSCLVSLGIKITTFNNFSNIYLKITLNLGKKSS